MSKTNFKCPKCGKVEEINEDDIPFCIDCAVKINQENQTKDDYIRGKEDRYDEG